MADLRRLLSADGDWDAGGADLLTPEYGQRVRELSARLTEVVH